LILFFKLGDEAVRGIELRAQYFSCRRSKLWISISKDEGQGSGFVDVEI
jgi:hypothetical protein